MLLHNTMLLPRVLYTVVMCMGCIKCVLYWHHIHVLYVCVHVHVINMCNIFRRYVHVAIGWFEIRYSFSIIWLASGTGM